MKFRCTSFLPSPQIPVVLRLITVLGLLSAVLTLVPQNTENSSTTPLPAQHPSLPSEDRTALLSLKQLLIPDLVCLLFLTWHNTRQRHCLLHFFYRSTVYRSKHWGWWSQASFGSPVSQFLPLTPRLKMCPSLSQRTERGSLCYEGEHWQRHCVDVSASGSVPYSKRCQIWDKSQLPRFSSACWPTALCTELIIKWSMAEVRQTPAGLTPLLAGCEHFLHISQPHITHSPQSSGCCTSAPAQTVQPNSTQPWENKPS